mmetsp:Transcript_36059/g.84543  ORF Transcript_36059/g.84543 Transcript_36059/m.84543 type:complete len:198 (-) Transcript_36059:85-678(-)|eukprot:CAMPEP_0178403110 /NCGR_PEP_ID=MMETSP0689_2-20121128/17198_1 /TAXON_ID=160604 /ORGANISM="Amphidinium massartii, Strain CS-259" /LENGTH=197 /DNA_ID=CAMNT_0020024051 /DNA_START=101 /DNA_END=694 /DNA_ORIENTATION=-
MSILGSDKFVFENETEWSLHEKVRSLSGDSFDIKNGDTGDVVIKADAANFTIGDSITCLDAETEEEIFTIREEKMHRVKHYLIKKGDEVFATVRKNMMSMHNTIVVYKGEAEFNMMNSTDAEILYTMKGGLISDRNTTLYKGDSDNDPVVAQAHEKRTNASGLLGQDEYEVTIQPGEDVAFLLACLIINDEILEDDD